MDKLREKLLEIDNIDPVDKADLLTRSCDPENSNTELQELVKRLQGENQINLLFIEKKNYLPSLS